MGFPQAAHFKPTAPNDRIHRLAPSFTRAWGDVSVFIRSWKAGSGANSYAWRRSQIVLALLVLFTAISPCPAQDQLPRPNPVPEFKPVPLLHTIAVPHDRPLFNIQMVNAAVLPRDREGIWVLDFAYKSMRIKTIEIPGKARAQVHYLYYKVVNRTGKPRMFVPQFTMVNEKDEKFEDAVIPQAIPVIQMREDDSIPVLGAVNVMGFVPPSTKENVDDAVFGVATWDKWDPNADRFSIYVRGLSDGYKEFPPGKDGKPVVKYKTLRLDFIRRGDNRNLHEKEIEPAEPPYTWVYW
jgi:hypothetical protein